MKYNSHEYLLEKGQVFEPLLAYHLETEHESWKKKAKEKLEGLLGLPLQRCEDEFRITSTYETEEYRSIVFEFQSEPGYMIPCEFIMPLGTIEKRPTVICLQGHSTGKHISLGIQKFDLDTTSVLHSNHAIRAVREGMCAVIFDQRYMGVAGQDKDGAPMCLRKNLGAVAAVLGRVPIGERVWDIQRLIDVLEKHFSNYVNLERIVCVGNSGGGTATFYAAALEERIYMAVPTCSVCRFEDSILAMFHCSCNHIPNIRTYFEMGDIGCLIAPRKLLIVNGAQDYMFPLEGAKACYEVISMAYEKLGHKDAVNMAVGDAGHQFYPELAWPVIKQETF